MVGARGQSKPPHLTTSPRHEGTVRDLHRGYSLPFACKQATAFAMSRSVFFGALHHVTACRRLEVLSPCPGIPPHAPASRPGAAKRSLFSRDAAASQSAIRRQECVIALRPM